jgi:Asp-tRNA(Asn)/Glu-tRNA(Gln) amidotransferase B subunit
MKHLTAQQIKTFEEALKQQGPEADPYWEVTQQLMKLVAFQAKEIINLQTQLELLQTGNVAASNALFDALARQAGAESKRTDLTQAEIDEAIANLNKAVKNYKSGKAAVKTAGYVLKFAAALL